MAKPEAGRDQKMAERTLKLNVLFALSSIALLITLSLMIWFDYAREWKKYQVAWSDLEQKTTRSQVEALDKQVGERLRAIEGELKAGEQQAQQNAAAIREAERELDRLERAEWYGSDQDFRFTKAKIDVARYEYDEAVHKKAGNADARKRHLDELEAALDKYRLEREAIEARMAEQRDKLQGLRQTQLAASTKRKDLLGEKTRLEERVRQLDRGVVWFVRNLPILEQFNPSLKINQILPANLYDDVIFTPTPKADRCTTCHLAIDKKGYESAEQPFRTHPNVDLYLRGSHPIERVGCTVCHQGRGRATGFHKAAHTAATKEQERQWGKHIGKHEYEPLHYWDYPMLAKGATESQCAKCHKDVVEVPKADRLNTGTFLIERYGCNGCHKIKGWEALRKVGPDLTRIASKTDEEFIYRWIKQPRGLRPTRMPQVWDVRVNETPDQLARNNVEANAVTAYLMSKSTRLAYPDPPKGDLDAGRKTFESVGCLACHRIGDDMRGIEGPLMASYRTHGPNLDGTGSKVNPGWLYAWVKDPKGYWHETKMPRLRLSDREAADITAYLMSLKNDEFRARQRPPLDVKLRDVIASEYLAAQYPVKQAEQQLQKMADPERTLFVGEKTIGRYGCFGCHTISGFEKASPIGVELTEEGSKLIERLDFGFEHGQIPHTLPAWFHRKLMEPRVFDRDKQKAAADLLRMPKFHTTPEEADAIVTAIMSFTKEQVPLAAQRQLDADDRYSQKGWRMVRDMNCQGCHKMGEKGGSIQAVVADQLQKSGGEVEQAGALSPPLLYNERAKVGEGSRVQTPWLHGFLRDPSATIRPWLALRMPTFDFTEEQANTLTHFFASLDRVPYPYESKPALVAADVAAGHDLFNRWQCVKCHVVAGKLPNQDPSNMAPDLAKVPQRLRADWLALWLKDPQKVQPGTRMPTNFPANPAENAFPEVLGGDQRRQIEAVRAYLLTLGGPRAN
jgi:cytochrome c2